MTVSNYLEAFLSVYGWAVYYTFFLLIGVTGLFLYPLLRSLLTILTEYLSGEGYDGIGYLKQAFVILALNMLVFFLALVPIARISFEKTTVGNICGEASVSVSDMNKVTAAQGAKFFSQSDARVPILPWLAMRLGQGFNNVVYKQLPCVMHTGDANRIILSLNTNDEGLDAELNAFINQCHRKAVNLIKEIRDGRYDQKTNNNDGAAQKWLNIELERTAHRLKQEGGVVDPNFKPSKNYKPSKEEEEQLIYSVDSPFIYDYFYSNASPMKNDASLRGILDGIPETMRATSKVEGFSGINGDGLPKCADWWKFGEGDSQKGLRYRLSTALEDDAVLKAASATGIMECQTEVVWGASDMARQRIRNPESCKAKLREVLIKKSSSAETGEYNQLVNKILSNHQGAKVHETEDVLTSKEKNAAVLSVFATIGAIAIPILRAFGIELAGDAIATVSNFYISIFILKMILRNLLPMIIMAIYMGWGIYMLIGELRGTTVVKGMITIFSVIIIPGLWAIADHIDDKLWDSMYNTGGTDKGSYFGMLLLDTTNGIFYFVILAAMFYQVNLAGGGDAGKTFGGGQKQATGLSGDLSGPFTRSGSKLANWLFHGKKDKQGNLVSGGWGNKGMQWMDNARKRFPGWLHNASGRISRGIKVGINNIKDRIDSFRNKP